MLFTLLSGGDSAIFAQRAAIAVGTADVVETPPQLSEETDSVAADTNVTAPRSASAIDSRIDYKAQDSLFFDMRINRAYLFEKAQVNYENIELTAGRIEIDFITREVSAFPRVDSLGREHDRPFFDDQSQKFEAREMVYNFQSKRARIKNIVMMEGEMLIHGDIVKKLPNDEAFVSRARFTTCELEHPHYFIATRRAKLIPNDKVVTGGAMMFLNDVPTPLALPFGLFPNSQKNTSGIIIPSYGESPAQGFFLRGGGFYWSINDYLDWRSTGDIYSRGDWNIDNRIQYSKRYKFGGGFSMNYGIVQSGERETDQYVSNRSMRVSWNHRQDPKANQNSTFSANVDFFNSASQRHSPLISDHFNNQSTSNIAYQVRIANRYNLSTTANLSYNTSSQLINATLPTIAFSMNPMFPFRPKVRKGAPKWYESFKINYSMNANNQVSGADSLFWSGEVFKDMRNGVRHNVPMEMNVKLFNGKINWNHSIQYAQQWHFKSIERGLDTTLTDVYDPDTDEYLKTDTTIAVAILNEQFGFFATHEYSYSSSFNTTLYGMLQFRRGYFRAFRHVMTPSAGFSYTPDFFTPQSGYRYYTDRAGNEVRYNRFEGTTAGIPGRQKAGSLNFSLNNSFEMKVRNRKDTVDGTRKIKLLDNLSLSTSYNLMADSLNWSPLSLSARTSIIRGLNLNYRATFSPYARDSATGRLYNKFLWQTDGKLFRRESDFSDISLSWSPSRRANTESRREASEDGEIFERPSIFDIPFTLSVSYSVGYRGNYRPGYTSTNLFGYPIDEPIYRDYHMQISQNLSFSGNFELTPKWKVSFTSGFDFMEKKLGLTQFNITRDLCCWGMSFTWVPFGTRKEWSFMIRLNSSMLGDALKYDRRSSFMDSMSNYN